MRIRNASQRRIADTVHQPLLPTICVIAATASKESSSSFHFNQLADSAAEHVASESAPLNTSAAAATRVAFCYAVALRSAGVKRRARHEYLLCGAEGGVMRESHASSVNLTECTTSRD